MDIKKRTLTATEESVLKNDLMDVEVWVNSAIDGKVANCKKRMIAEWLPKLYADESVTQIPANENDMIAMVVARNDYLDRAERENGYPSGEPADSWTEAQLQNYLNKHSVEYEKDDAKSALLTKAKAKYAELNS